MESIDFPFLSQDLDFNSLLALLQDEMDHAGPADVPNRKRQRSDEHDALREVLASFVVMEEAAAVSGEEKGNWAFDSLEDKAIYEPNCRKRALSVDDYYYQSQVDSYCIDRSNEFELCESGTAPVVDSPKRGREGSGNPTRRLWVKDRSKDWWERVSSPDFPDAEFKRAFRMSRATFDMICQELDPVITKKNTTLRDAIPVRQRVAVCIWRLATGEPLRLVSKKFGLGISTCHKLILEVSKAIKEKLLPKFVQWPSHEQLNSIKEEFEAISGIPNIGGSMYTTHIPIIAPKGGVSAYYNKRQTERNQKTSYSVTVQGVVDPKGLFTDLSIGCPGSMSDDQVLEQSTLFKKASSGQIHDTFIAGNSGYPLIDWILVPYSENNLTWPQHAFNDKMDEALSVGKAAFSRLKSRWACLQKRTEVKLQDLPVILGACCVLHNVCEMNGEEVEPEQMFEVFDDVVVPENCARGSPAAAQARDQIARNLLHHGH